MAPVSWLLVREVKVHRESSDGTKFTLNVYFRKCWDLMSSKAFFYVVIYNFFGPFVGGISTTAGSYVKKEWAGVHNLQNQMFSLISSLLFSATLYVVKKKFLNYSWRKMLFATAIVLIVTDMFFVFLTIFDIVRNQYFYLGESILIDIPAAANFVVGTYIIVEMAEEGNEGLTYGLLTTVANLSSPFSRAVGNQIYGRFKPDLSDSNNFKEDSHHFRDIVAYSFGLSYAFNLLSLSFLLLIPNQKAMAQERKQTWGRKSIYAWTTCSLLGFSLAYSISMNFLTMFPKTMCLGIAGGNGCSDTS